MTNRPELKPLPTELDLPSLEQETLKRWEATGVFARSLQRTADGPRWTFYEGPPTANGKPGTHHVEARVFKDLFPRFKTMKGFHVQRRGGWDCHGLPVELAVEKELGFTGKADIEVYGIAEFNAKCRESALGNVAQFEAMTRRMGYWVDMDSAYLTMSPQYVQSVWWALKTIFDKGLLVEDYRVTPYCPKDGTPLSDHEVSQGYQDVTDLSVYVLCPLVDGPFADRGASLLVWTTTPWTLVSNTAVAVNPGVDYALVEAKDGRLVVVAADLVASAGEDARVLEKVPGSALVGSAYRRPFDLVDEAGFGQGAHRVLGADYVTVESGTGLVHQAPAFGADDWAVCRTAGLELVNPIDATGHFEQDVPLVGGLFFKDADQVLVDDLRERGLLWRLAPYTHSYPFCWRCHTALIYYALPSWYIRTTAIRETLLASNEATNWYPARIKHGRYGAWLDNNVDWALSRNRYWGTPLPVWRCTADPSHLTCVGSLTELGDLAGADLSDLDPHRPYVDDIVLTCAQCGQESRRVPEVVDVWFDSGAMPFAQWGAPHQNLAEFEAAHPAQFICEAIDQTRGWFYSLMAIGALLHGRSPYENVVCLGLILDGEGRKMSKHLGNVLDPFTLFDAHGADAVRWLMLAGGSPWADRRLGVEAVEEAVRKVLLTYWNTASFFAVYAHANGWSYDPAAVPSLADRPVIDRWIVSELHATVAAVDAALEDFDSAGAARQITALLDSLSNWYVRRSRRRFWAGDPAAFATLHECLQTLTRLLAPFTPFLTDYLWGRLFATDEVDSVHLAQWPVADAAVIDERLREQMRLVQRAVEVGRATRAAAKVRTRQPLARAMVAVSGFEDLGEELRAEIAEELNVAEVTLMTDDLVETSLKPNWRALGARFGKGTQKIAAAVSQAEPPASWPLTVVVDGAEHEIAQDEVTIAQTPREGWAVSTEAGTSVALDLEITDELRREGLVRDVLRVVQDQRKAAGLEVTDRIEVRWSSTDAETARAVREHAEQIAAEVLAVAFSESPAVQEASGQWHEHVSADLGLMVRLIRRPRS
ncbi:MAG: isoleucine--tRNA ligase [Actinomycetales bacterium]|nr:isoleucine--tRNA ligase [Actinomycetales bacterium]